MNEFRDYAWRPLNSYLHSGIHAVRRKAKGFPIYLLAAAIKQSNNLANMTLMALAELSGDGLLAMLRDGLVSRLWGLFAAVADVIFDCRRRAFQIL